ncbi:GNAT family N-acetyltransferase [Micromonospora fluostatini]|uniref:GNAT family N-acetyltransferase n=1 Tax=Micromonospora sp. JCM 30529 TaxID=3421643 RepID=UPI003D170E3F
MIGATSALDVGAALRALRRRADLSQRELAARSGVPKSTIARLEAGQGADPRLRTVERLVRAVGGELTIDLPGERGEAGGPPALPRVPHEELRDEAGRRYPAHLDVWPVREPKDWPGAWWAHWYNLPPKRWPLRLPAATYERNRGYRDARRRAEQVRREVVVRRVTGGGLPDTSWRFVAELPDGTLLGELRAHERSPYLDVGSGAEAERELVLDGCLVVAEHRRLGIGRRLVTALADEMVRRGVGGAYALAVGNGIDLLLACGFRIEAGRPAEMRLRTPPAPPRQPSAR